MEIEKTIMDLLKKYMEQTKSSEADDVVENAKNDNDVAEKDDEKDGFVTPKTEKLVFEETAEEPKIEADKESAVVVTEPTEAAEESQEKESEKKTDYSAIKPETWQEAEKVLQDIENGYSEILPEEVDEGYLKLDRKEEVETTKEDVIDQVNSELNEQKAQEEAAINQKIDDKSEDVESQKKTVAEKYSSATDTINTAYDAARVKAENDALKRGLARSSIICEELSKIEKDRAEKLIEKQEELEKSLENLEAELAALEQDRTNSIDKLNLSYAVKIQNEIDKKLKELQKRQDEVLEYNNKVAEIEHKYNIKVETTIAQKRKEAEEAAKLANQNQQKAKEDEQVAVITNYFSRFDTEKAIAELQKHSEIASKYGIDVYYRVYRNLIKVKE